jgi:hypothetical protein
MYELVNEENKTYPINIVLPNHAGMRLPTAVDDVVLA